MKIIIALYFTLKKIEKLIIFHKSKWRRIWKKKECNLLSSKLCSGVGVNHSTRGDVNGTRG